MAGAVVLERFSSIEEALVVQSLLRANGINTALDNGYHAQNDWVMVPALFGIGLLAKPSDAQGARRTIQVAKTEARQTLSSRWCEGYEAPERRRLFRKWSFPVLYLTHPVAFVFYLALAGLLSVLENRRMDRSDPIERTPDHDPACPI